MAECQKCGASLSGDDIGATKKFINRGATEFFCTICLSERFGISHEDILIKIEEYRRNGCALFS